MTEAELDVRVGRVVDAAFRIRRALGPGLLESAYEACLAHELRLMGSAVEVQLALPLTYRGLTVEAGYRIDMLVDECVVVELKACSTLQAVHSTQLLSYLRLGGYRVGLLINFHSPMLKQGIRRIINGY